ncbi:MAG: hypothetical protein K5928_01695 [Prevotella sp.]|nr:hypothetical protein [Prevotella sp.]
MKTYKVLMVVAAILTLSACGTTKNSSPYTVATELQFNMNDLVFLGESEISCEYDTYLGFIRQISKINGEPYQPGKDVKLNLSQGMINLNGKGMKLAAAKIIQDYPDATYFIKVMDTKETDVLFLGATTKRTAKVRAYKFKK